jgi:hypothetical protein
MTRSSLSLRLTCPRCPSHHSLPPPQLPQSSDACAVNTAAACSLGLLCSPLLSRCAGHISRLQLVLNELRVPWKEYLRQKREEEQRSVVFKRPAHGAPPPPPPSPPFPSPPHAAFCAFLADERVQRLQFSPAPTARISPAPL